MSEPIASNLPLDALVQKIEEHTQAHSDHVVQAALYFREVRRRILSGEAGEGVDWRQWARDHIRIGESRLRELMFIADSPDPERALLEGREKTRLRVERHRQKKDADWARLGPIRQRLISHIKGADEQRVRQIHNWVFSGDGPVSHPVETPSSAGLGGTNLH